VSKVTAQAVQLPNQHGVEPAAPGIRQERIKARAPIAAPADRVRVFDNDLEASQPGVLPDLVELQIMSLIC